MPGHTTRQEGKKLDILFPEDPPETEMEGILRKWLMVETSFMEQSRHVRAHDKGTQLSQCDR